MEDSKKKQESSVGVAEPPAPPAQAPGKQEKQVKIKPPKKKRKWVKRLIVIVVIAALLALVLTQCMKGAQQTISAAYIPEAVGYRDLTVSVSGTGTIQPIDSYKATALVKGEVLEAPFEEGDTVNKDDMLFRIDAKNVESTIQQQEISLRNAQLSLDTLLKNQSDAAKNQRVEANAAGVITKLYVDQGDNVAAGTPIADILDRDHMKLTVPFHAVDAAAFFVGQAATVTVDGTLETLTGTIDSIAATDTVGAGGALVRNVTVLVNNPGALSDASSGTAAVGAATCASSVAFEYGQSKQVVAKYSGELKSLTVKEGDRVSDGQQIGSFDSTDMDNQIASARLSIEAAELSLQNARDSLEDYTITSPISGTVIEMNYKVGDNVDPTSSAAASAGYLAVVYNMSALEFEMKIDELDISKIHVGQAVEITADALDGKTFTGRVDKVNINGTTAGGVTTYPVTIMVDDPEELLPGMNVSAKIIVEQAGNVLCVPVDAVKRGNTVTVADAGALSEDGLTVVDPTKTRQVEVTLGRNDSAYIEVTSGLAEGDVVLLENQSSNFMAMMMGG